VGPKLGAEDRQIADRLGVGREILEGGSLPDSELPARYNAVDLLLFPSLYEGFGWPPLEAMASGTPVVCSRAGSLDEIVGEAALTADPEDVETLAWHAGASLTDAAVRTEMIRRGLQHVLKFNWDRTAQEMVDVYRSVAEAA
jgi:glycosyltransferase involved in cell wall biosynthesis